MRAIAPALLCLALAACYSIRPDDAIKTREEAFAAATRTCTPPKGLTLDADGLMLYRLGHSWIMRREGERGEFYAEINKTTGAVYCYA